MGWYSRVPSSLPPSSSSSGTGNCSICHPLKVSHCSLALLHVADSDAPIHVFLAMSAWAIQAQVSAYSRRPSASQPQPAITQVSHIMRLPMELLDEILSYCCIRIHIGPNNYRPCMDSWSLRGVCRRWRRCLFESLQLWRDWYLDLQTITDLPRSRSMMTSAIDYCDSLFDFLIPFLTRSSKPLELILIWPMASKSQEDLCKVKLVQAIVAQSKHWRRLSLVISEGFKPEEEIPLLILQDREFPRLETLTLSFYCSVQPITNPRLFSRCQSLRDLHLIFPRQRLSFFLPWRQLTNLSLYTDTRPATLALLSGCKALEELELFIDRMHGDNILDIANIHIRLDKLRTLKLELFEATMISHHDPFHMLLPFWLFTLPELQTLNVHSPEELFEVENEHRSLSVRWDSTEFTSFVSRSGCSISSSHSISRSFLKDLFSLCCKLYQS